MKNILTHLRVGVAGLLLFGAGAASAQVVQGTNWFYANPNYNWTGYINFQGPSVGYVGTEFQVNPNEETNNNAVLVTALGYFVGTNGMWGPGTYGGGSGTVWTNHGIVLYGPNLNGDLLNGVPHPGQGEGTVFTNILASVFIPAGNAVDTNGFSWVSLNPPVYLITGQWYLLLGTNTPDCPDPYFTPYDGSGNSPAIPLTTGNGDSPPFFVNEASYGNGLYAYSFSIYGLPNLQWTNQPIPGNIANIPVAIMQDVTGESAYTYYPATFSMVVTGSVPISVEWQTNVPGSPTFAGDATSLANDYFFYTNTTTYTVYGSTANNGEGIYGLATNNFGGTTYSVGSSTGLLSVIPNVAYPDEFLHGPSFGNATTNLANGADGGIITIGHQSVEVTHLGYYAGELGGEATLQNDHHLSIYLWNGGSPVLLGYTIVTAGTPVSSAINGYIWAPLNPPLLLTSNTVYLATAETFNANGNSLNGPEIDPWGDTYVVPDLNNYFAVSCAAIWANGNVWPTPPTGGNYANQMYSCINLAILTNTFSAFVVPTNIVAVRGVSTNLTALVAGQPPVTVQWYQTNNGVVTLLTGQTNVILSFPFLDVSNNGTYYFVATNTLTLNGETSTVSTVTVITNAVYLGQYPVTQTNILNTNFMTLYAGANPFFSVSVTGFSPITFRWYTNYPGASTVVGTSSNLTLANVQTNFTIYCVASNAYSSDTSEVWSATVLAAPTNPYPQTVMALNPIGYWRLNDTNLDGVDDGNGDNGYVCHDYISGNDGIFTNVYLGQPGYDPTSDPTTTSAEFDYINTHDCDANSILNENLSVPNGANAELTVEAWVNGQVANGNAGIANKGYFNQEEFSLDCGGPGSGYRFEVRNAASTVYNATNGFVTSAYPGDNQWHHLVGVCDEANGLVTLYIDGKVAGTTAIPTGTGLQNSDSTPMDIGARPSNAGSGLNNQFGGYVNDVAVYKTALTSNQVLNQYLLGAQVSPYFNPAPPASIVGVVGAPLTIPATAFGTPVPGTVMGYQWTLGANVLQAGSTNGPILPATFVTNSTPLAWNGQNLVLTVTNDVSPFTTNVSVAVTVTEAPILESSLPSPVIVGQGQTYTYSILAAGELPLSYQWYSNSNGTAIVGATATNYTPPTSSAGTNYYSVVVTNSYGSPATSGISTFIVIPLPNTVLASTIQGMGPVAYWPMHETTLPTAPGDIETNYGISGLAETGYYPDWYGINFPGSFQHGYAGAIQGDANPTSVLFDSIGANVGSEEFTNGLYIPNATKGAVLNPPFTVECWFWPGNTGANNDVWSQNGFEGLNAGNEGAGGGSVCGIRLYVGGNFTLYTYKNSSTLNTVLNGIGEDTNQPVQWYHIVVTCDASTNFSLYTNGYQCSTTVAGAALYAPDYWTPIEIGNGRGQTRPKLDTAVDDFAVYTNALSAATILADYQAGTNLAPATSYFATITNNNPWIFYRMDSPTYNVPAQSTLPVLYNYGSVVGNGVYSPGTLPGVLPGPSGIPGVGTNFTGGTNVALLEGVSSFADAGYNPVWAPKAAFGTGSNAFSVTCMFRGNPANGTYQDLVSQGDSGWKIDLTANNANGAGTVLWDFGGNFISYGVVNDGNWHQMVGTHNPNATAAPQTILLYVDGVLRASQFTCSSNGISGGSSYDVLLGAAPDYTNNPYGVGRQLNGEVCDVAIFTNALGPNDVRALYVAAGGVPTSLSISGYLPLSRNLLGTSNLLTLYSNVSPSFAVTVTGVPAYYQWYTNGPGVGYAGVGFGTNSVLTLPNVQNNFATYCIVTNVNYQATNYGATSVVWSATVTADPDPAGSFSQVLISDNPMAYWRLNESPGSTLAIDYAGGANGVYGNQTTNLPGAPIVAATPEFGVVMDPNPTTASQGTITNSGIILQTNAMTVVCWVNPWPNNGNPAGIFQNRSTAASSGPYLDGTKGSPAGVYDTEEYNWAGASTAYNYGGPTGIPTNKWGMVVFEEAPQNAYFWLYGLSGLIGSYSNSANYAGPIESFLGGNAIGMDPNGGTSGGGRILHGVLNELAIFNYDLSVAQLNALYLAATNNALNVQPFIVTQPKNVTTVVTTAKTNFTAAASSFMTPLTYGWYYNSTASYVGATALTNGVQFGAWFTNVYTPSLTITNVTFAAAGFYFVAVTNSAAITTNSAIVQLTVTPLTTPSPSATFSVSANQLTLGWPLNYTGWRLQAMTNPLLGTNNLVGTNWANVTGATATNQVIIPMDVNQGSVLYRLIYP